MIGEKKKVKEQKWHHMEGSTASTGNENRERIFFHCFFPGMFSMHMEYSYRSLWLSVKQTKTHQEC